MHVFLLDALRIGRIRENDLHDGCKRRDGGLNLDGIGGGGGGCGATARRRRCISMQHGAHFRHA